MLAREARLTPPQCDQLRGKHVPVSLTVAPAHHWNIADEALDHITALIDMTAKKMAKDAHKIAGYQGRKTILASDFRLVKDLLADGDF